MRSDHQRNQLKAAAAIGISFIVILIAGCGEEDSNRLDFSNSGVLQLSPGQTGSVQVYLFINNVPTLATAWNVDPVPQDIVKQITINPTVNSSLATITVVASDSVPTDRGAAVDHGFLEVPVHVTAQTEEGHITGLLTLRLTPATLQLTNVSSSLTSSFSSYALHTEGTVSVTNDPTTEPYQYTASAVGRVTWSTRDLLGKVIQERTTVPSQPPTVAITPTSDGRQAKISLDQAFTLQSGTPDRMGWTVEVVATAKDRTIRRRFSVAAEWITDSP